MRDVPGYFAAECEHCKELLQVKLPLRAKAIRNIAFAFEDAHEDCRPSETTQN
jgi:hypothetical protein